MKKLITLFFCILVLQTTVKADDDKPIEFSQLPQQSQTFVKKYFGNTNIALVKMDDGFFDRSYKIIFTNGDKIDFDKKGQWTEIDCKYTNVPSASIPSKIGNYVKRNYPDARIVKIEKENKQRHEVKLSNGLELKFDSRFNVVDIDD